MAACHLDRDKLKTNPEANERKETGNVLKNALRREADDTEEPSLSVCPSTEVLKDRESCDLCWSTGTSPAEMADAALGQDVSWRVAECWEKDGRFSRSSTTCSSERQGVA